MTSEKKLILLVIGVGVILSQCLDLPYYRKLIMHVDNTKKNLRYTKLTQIFQKLGLHALN